MDQEDNYNDDALIPEEFLCPLTLDIMQQPVMTRWGHNFERHALMKWMESHDHCPLTRNPIALKDVITNRALQARILQWQHEHNHHHYDDNKATRTNENTNNGRMWWSRITNKDRRNLVLDEDMDQNDQILPFLINVDSPQGLIQALKRTSDHGKYTLRQYLQQQQEQQQQIQNEDHDGQPPRGQQMLLRQRAAFAA